MFPHGMTRFMNQSKVIIGVLGTNELDDGQVFPVTKYSRFGINFDRVLGTLYIAVVDCIVQSNGKGRRR